MTWTVTQTTLPEVQQLERPVFGDGRGCIFASFNAREFERATGLQRAFVQDDHGRSVRGVLRGLHYQVLRPRRKLVRVVEGEAFEVAVCLRKNSPTLGRWAGVCLSAQTWRQLWVPEGFAHGFFVVIEWAEVLSKTKKYWYPQHDRSLLWNDPAIGIELPLGAAPRLAAKDVAAKRLDEDERYGAAPSRA